MNQAGKIVAVLLAICGIALIVLFGFWVKVGSRLAAAPKPIYQPFDQWGESWTTPVMADGDYWISLEYARSEGGRLDTPLRVKLVDMATKQEAPTAGRWVGGTTFNDTWDTEIVGEFRAVEGHRYRIEIDREQIEQLAPFHHRLRIGLSAVDLDNRIGKALFE
jgi:hypothetical protein